MKSFGYGASCRVEARYQQPRTTEANRDKSLFPKVQIFRSLCKLSETVQVSSHPIGALREKRAALDNVLEEFL